MISNHRVWRVLVWDMHWCPTPPTHVITLNYVIVSKLLHMSVSCPVSIPGSVLH